MDWNEDNVIKADLIIYNGTVLTLDKVNTEGRSLTSYKGRITGVWNTERPPEKQITRSEKTVEIDLNGKTIMPGFVDTHNHLLMYSQNKAQVNCTSPLHKNIKDLQTNIAKESLAKEKGEWILGYGYDDTMLDEKRHPTIKDLDAISTDHPIFIRHISGHLAVANSVALKIAGVDKDTPKPNGGYFGKDRNGELTGVLYEPGAMDIVFDAVPVPSTEEIVELIRRGAVDYLAQGITTNTDAGVGLHLLKLEYDAHILAVQKKANPMKMRLMILSYLLEKGGDFSEYSAAELDAEIRGKTNGRAKLDSAKLFQDGSIQGLTGALREPYYCNPKLYGDLIYTQEQLNNYVMDFHQRGFRIATHGNGDYAINSVIEAYESAIKTGGERDHRHRIEHVQTATEDDLKKMKSLDIAASFFINHIYYWGDRHRDIFLGPDRAKRMNALREADDLDMLYTLHSDCPITPISPLFSIWAAVNRITRDGEVLGEDQKIDVETALKSMTIYGAELNFEEDEVGSIEVGKAADFVVLEENPITIDPIKIKDIQIEMTIIDGELVYKSS
ncbi:amidohydrolase [Sporosarcina sp. P12(2017)]|uniref:amidohydrolase n=1 Tax=Sporosarcina sp. P12(2017) TaxID=2048561 RepID=UPI0018EAAD42|nr:amidohydrolase [Sporosarcina sp. P12(2017)]